MDPTLVIMAVRAAIQLGRAGDQAFGLYARDRDVILPFIDTVPFPKRDVLRGYFEAHPELISVPLKPIWNSFTAQPGAPHLVGDLDILSVEYARLQALSDAKFKSRAAEVTGLWMVKQWAKGDEPPGPVIRIVLTLVDIAAEFAAYDPKIFGVDGNAEALVKALATRIVDLLPDDADALGPRNLLGERLAGMFLKAGLGALSEHPEAIVEDAHLQSLVKNTLPILVKSLPNSLDQQVQWRNVVETLLGPVAGEAMRTVATHPQAFFGNKFGDDDLLGALTRTFLLKAADVGLEDTFTKTGALQLYKATLSLAAARPDLFIGAPAGASGKLIAGVFHDLAATLEQSSPPFDHSLVTTLAANTIATLAQVGNSLLDLNKPWENILSQTLTPILATLAASVRTGDTAALQRLASPSSIESLVRVVVAHIAKTPGMIFGSNSVELKGLVSAVAGAMAQDEHLLLSQDDWTAILGVVAEETVANPGRLLGTTGDTAASSLLATLLGDLLSTATVAWQGTARSGGNVLFGATLREAMLILIPAAAGQASAAQLNSAKLKQLASQITDLVTTLPGQYGSKEWLCLYRALIMRVLETGNVALLDDATINTVLAAAGAHA